MNEVVGQRTAARAAADRKSGQPDKNSQMQKAADMNTNANTFTFAQ